MTAEPALVERLAAMEDLDEQLIHEGRFVSLSFLLEAGAESCVVTIDRGRVVSVSRAPAVMPQWAFALRASAEEWARFWEAVPSPGSNDLFALMRRKQLRAEGDLHPFMANLLYFKALLATPRTYAIA